MGRTNGSAWGWSGPVPNVAPAVARRASGPSCAAPEPAKRAVEPRRPSPPLLRPFAAVLLLSARRTPVSQPAWRGRSHGGASDAGAYTRTADVCCPSAIGVRCGTNLAMWRYSANSRATSYGAPVAVASAHAFRIASSNSPTAVTPLGSSSCVIDRPSTTMGADSAIRPAEMT